MSNFGESEGGIVVANHARLGIGALVHAQLAAQGVALATASHVGNILNGPTQGAFLGILHDLEACGDALAAVGLGGVVEVVGEVGEDIGNLSGRLTWDGEAAAAKLLLAAGAMARLAAVCAELKVRGAHCAWARLHFRAAAHAGILFAAVAEHVSTFPL